MTYDELTYDQKNQLAGDYLCRLADEGTYAEVMGVTWDAPSWDEMGCALELVPDDVMRREYEGYCFGEDDFWS